MMTASGPNRSVANGGMRQAHYLSSSISCVELVRRHRAHHALVVDEQHRRIAAGAHAFAFLQRERAIGGGFAETDAELLLQVLGAVVAPGSAHGRLVQTVSLCLPTGLRLYML